MKILLLKDWNDPDISRQLKVNNPNKIDVHLGLENSDDYYDLLIIFNNPEVDIRTKARNSWLLSQESPIERYNYQTRSYKYFDKVFAFWDLPNVEHEQTCLPWHINKSYEELITLSVNDLKKTSQISWITSNRTDKEGHRLRLGFLEYLKQENFNLDLFGKGFNPIEDKFDGIAPYYYSIAIENYACNDYWTEKIADCFLSWTMPVYYGAKNITKYFPEKSMILIDPNKPQWSLDKVKEAIRNKLFQERTEYIQEARELILDKYQFFPWVYKKYIDLNIVNLPYQEVTIPKNVQPQNTRFYFIRSILLRTYKKMKKWLSYQ